MFLQLFCSLFVVFIFYHVSRQGSGIRRHGKRLPRLPGTLPLAGYGIWFLQPRHKWLARLAELQPQLGLDTFELQIPTLPPAVMINDPKNLEFVLKDIDLFVKGAFTKSNTWDLFGYGILNADGDLWRIQRKAGLRFFSNSNLQYFVDEVLPRFLKDLHLRLDEAARNNTIIDLQAGFLDITTRLMGTIAYDVDISSELPFSHAFEYASSITSEKFTNPLWRITDLVRGAKFTASVNEVKRFGAGLVSSAQSKRSKYASTSRGCAPAHTVLIDSFLDNISSPQVVADAAVNFLSAGRDTTAQSMAWTVYSLLRNPSSMDRVLNNLRRAFPSHNRNQCVTLRYKDISDPHAFPYVQACFMEALRLNPAVPLELKESTAPCMLPDGTSLPKGSVVVWIPYTLARSTTIWGTDALAFRPERWLDQRQNGDTRLLTRDAFDNPVFNAGPRMCVGKKMAIILALRVLIDVLWQWELEEVRGLGEVDGVRVIGESLTAPVLGGLPVKVRRAELQTCP